MAKKFPSAPPEEGEGWLTSYADLMSLLSCFFMLMMAFANYDPPGVQRKAKIIAETFINKGGGPLEQDLEKLQQEIAHHPDFEKRMKMTLRDGELKIVFAGSAVFPEGAYLLDGSTTSMLDTLIDMIRARDTEYRILIEGHADKDEALLAGNMNHWSLSAARAANVIARFEYFGFKAEYMAAIAKGDREPVAEYRDAIKKGRPSREIAKLNRRAVIKILEPIGDKPANVRVGALFQEAQGGEPPSDSGLFREDLVVEEVVPEVVEPAVAPEAEAPSAEVAPEASGV